MDLKEKQDYPYGGKYKYGEKYKFVAGFLKSWSNEAVRLNNMYVRAVSVSLRGTGLLLKFVLLIFFAKYLEPSVVGIYGLLSGTITYFIFALGFEFYTYSMRELIVTDEKRWLFLLKNQTVFFIFPYLVFAPIALFLVMNSEVPDTYVLFFLLLLFLEHAAQEINRILVATAHQLLASIVLFVRSGAWGLLLIPIMFFFPETRTLTWVMFFWMGGVGLSCLIGFSRIARFSKTNPCEGIDWEWIKRGVRVAFPLLLASLALRGIFTLDRYWIEHISGLEILGSYTLFIGMASSIVLFIDAGVIAFLYPNIIKAVNLKKRAAFFTEMKSLVLGVSIVAVVGAAGIYICSKYLLVWLGNESYQSNAHMLNWLLLALVIYAASMIPHMILYAFKCDRAILGSQVAGFTFFMGGCVWGAGDFGAVIVPYSLIFTFSTILVWKTISCFFIRDSWLYN